MKLPSAMASVAGAGPNRSAVVMKKVSEMVTLADTDPIFIENEPVITASAAKKSHSYRCGVVCSDTSEWMMTSIPSAATSWIQWRSDLFISVLLHRVAPQDLVAFRRSRIAPEDFLAFRVIDRVSPQNFLVSRPLRHVAPENLVRTRLANRI